LAAAIDIADAAPAALRQKALMGLGDFAERQNDVDAARRYASESVELARDAGDEQALAGSLLLLGLIEADAGNLVPAEQLQREALRLFSELGSDANVRMTLGMLGFLLIVQARLPEAEEVCERALHLSRVANDKRGIVVGAGNLGHVRASLGDVPGALCLLREAFVLSNELSDVHWVAEVLTDISRVALAVGDLDTAATLVGAVSQLEETAQFELTAAYRAWFDEIVAQVGDRKGAGAAALAFERGARLNEDELVERTLGFIDRHLAVNPSRDGDGAPLIPATDS
jgi:tetratricopeptide (TPR) repeat protein